MQVKKKKSHKKSNGVPGVLISLLLMTAAAFGAATVWQGIQDSAAAASPYSNSPGSASKQEEVDDAQAVPANENKAPSAISSPTPPDIYKTQPEPDGFDEPIDYSREDYPYALPLSDRVPNSYFDDAIFFGDSISIGIMTYNMMPNAAVAAFTGITTVNATTKECVMTQSCNRVTLLDSAKEYGDKKKVYIMLGGNGLWYDKAAFIDGYIEFIDAVKAQYPNAIIYIQTMTPVTDYVSKTYPAVSNEVINEYNLAIHDMAKEKKVYLVDVASALIDEYGKLPSEASPVDGMHLMPEYYHKWFEYLRTHTAPQ